MQDRCASEQSFVALNFSAFIRIEKMKIPFFKMCGSNLSVIRFFFYLFESFFSDEDIET